MITAIDTNVLLDILLPNPEFCDAAVRAIENAAAAGSLVICGLVYAELCVHFSTQPGCDEFLADNKIRVEPLSPVGRPDVPVNETGTIALAPGPATPAGSAFPGTPDKAHG